MAGAPCVPTAEADRSGAAKGALMYPIRSPLVAAASGTPIHRFDPRESAVFGGLHLPPLAHELGDRGAAEDECEYAREDINY